MDLFPGALCVRVGIGVDMGGGKTTYGGKTMAYITMKELLEAGVHFGHQTKRWNPKMKPYIFGARNGIYIIDLQKTVRFFKTVYDFVVETVSKGNSVLFVGTKKQARESIYEEALCVEFDLRGIQYARQAEVDVVYKDHIIKGQRVDLLVENEVVVELKAITHPNMDLIMAQVLSYLYAAKLQRGLIINFNVPRLVDGVKRVSA